ncbi:carbohydrate ABC transporter permease [Fusibacter ferrireducens]|nr:sugar ABC transporter permease [Fusibacter ferrireducens]
MPYLLMGFTGFTLFYIWPFILSAKYAFTDKPANGIFVGLKNFIELFHSKPYLLGLENTLYFICISVPLAMSISLLLAMLINRVEKYKAVFTLIFMIPLVMPSGSMVFFWKALFSKKGYINFILSSIGISSVNWLESTSSIYVIVLIFIWKNMGYNMILFMVGLHNIPKMYYEAASIDGAGAVQSFFKITLPELIPTTVLVTIMSIINSFKIFKEVYLLTGNYPNERIYMLQHFMNNMFYALNYPKLTTATCVLVLVITPLVYFLLWFERRQRE